MATGGREEPQRATRETTAGRGARDSLVESPPEETSLLGFVNIVLRHRGLIIGCALLGTVVCLAIALRETRTYSTAVMFTARGAKSGLLAGIAAQYGLSIVGADPSQSLEFYESLMNSPELLREVAKQQYEIHTRNGVRRGQLPVFYGIHAGSHDAEIALAMRRLGGSVSTTSTRRTGIVTYVVSSPNPELTQQIARNMVEQVNHFNLQGRQSQAGAERDFIEKRLDETRAALARAEDQLRSFRDLNREYATSAKLSLENDRLNREVTMRQQLYTALSQAYDQARIEEVRDIPTITVLEPPGLPTSPNTEYGIRNTLLGTIAGMLVGIMLAFGRERLYESQAAGSRTFADFSDLKRDTLHDLAQPWEPVGRLFRAPSGP
jgi:uncharacterized protein involved in exopolysaccharide biosynthesis